MRYVEDFMPSLILLVSVQLIRGARISNRNSGIRTILASATAILTLFTVTANLLVAMPPSGTVYMIELLNTLSKVLGLK
jgi:hypothetical protein